MKREHFVKVVEEALDSLPQEFRSHIRNVAILVEDVPPNQPSPQSGQQRRLLLGLFHGVPTTKKSMFDLPRGPDHIVLYQKNIEAVCSSEAEVREQIRLTVMHELGHYFGMDENQLKDVQLGGLLPVSGITERYTARVYSLDWVVRTLPMSTPSPTVDDMERHRAAVTRYIRYLVRDAAEAEDLAQETLLRAYRQRTTLRDSAALASWLYQIATHVSIDRLRQRARTVERQVDAPIEDLPIADRKRPSPLTIVQQTEMSHCVQRYVANLSDAYKAVLLFHDADGLTADEIAHLLQLPLTTVKMRLHRARRQLEAALNNACAFERDDRGVFICEPKPNSK